MILLLRKRAPSRKSLGIFEALRDRGGVPALDGLPEQTRATYNAYVSMRVQTLAHSAVVQTVAEGSNADSSMLSDLGAGRKGVTDTISRVLTMNPTISRKRLPPGCLTWLDVRIADIVSGSNPSDPMHEDVDLRQSLARWQGITGRLHGHSEETKGCRIEVLVRSFFEVLAVRPPGNPTSVDQALDGQVLRHTGMFVRLMVAELRDPLWGGEWDDLIWELRGLELDLLEEAGKIEKSLTEDANTRS